VFVIIFAVGWKEKLRAARPASNLRVCDFAAGHVARGTAAADDARRPNYAPCHAAPAAAAAGRPLRSSLRLEHDEILLFGFLPEIILNLDKRISEF